MPDVHGEDLRILRGIVDQRPGVQPPGVSPGDVGPGQVLLVLDLIDDDAAQLLLQLHVGIVELVLVQGGAGEQVVLVRSLAWNWTVRPGSPQPDISYQLPRGGTSGEARIAGPALESPGLTSLRESVCENSGSAGLDRISSSLLSHHSCKFLDLRCRLHRFDQFRPRLAGLFRYHPLL